MSVEVSARARWSIADQAVSSLGNFALAVVAARLLTADEFGAFAVALAFYLLAVGTARATCAELLVIRHSHGDVKGQGRAVFGAAVLVGALASAGAIVGALVTSGTLSTVLVALAITLPGLLLQDTLRYYFVADGRPSSALVNDLVWTGLQVVLVGGLIVADGIDAFSITLAWGVAATLAAVVGCRQAATLPSLSEARGWFSANRSLWPRYVVEFLATMGAWQVALFTIGGIAGLATLGGLRAAQVLYGPLHVVNYGARLAVIPEGVRARSGGGAQVRRTSVRVALVTAGIALAWTVAVALVPDDLGIALLGDSWTDAEEVRVQFGLFMALEAVVVAATVGLRILVAATDSLVAAGVKSVLLVAIAAACATTGEMAVIGWGLVLAGLLGAVVWWVQLWRSSGKVAAMPLIDPVHG